MRVSDLNRDLDDLRRWYYMEKGKCVCLCCDQRLAPEAIDAHLEGHTDAEKFELLVNADSVFGFNATQKAFLQLLFSQGLKDKEIGRLLGLSPSTAQRIRNGFIAGLREARGMLLLNDLLGNALQRRGYTSGIQENLQLPALNEEGIVRGFYSTKRQIHAAGLLHPTTIILVAMPDSGTGEPSLLVVDKGDQQLSSDVTPLALHAYDLLGNHVRRADAPTMALSQPFPWEEAMWNCARNQLDEELSVYTPGKTSLPLDEGHLFHLYTDRYTGPSTEGENNENSWVLVFRFPPELYHDETDIRLEDDWVDTLGGAKERKYVCKFWPLRDILREVVEKPGDALDGIRRVLGRLESDPELMRKFRQLAGCEV